jgi:carboxyl-terminal processing protease
MLEDLDPHSQFLDGLDYEDLMVSTRGEFGGLGIFISFRDNYPTVISPIADTPGERAGLRGGDQIVEIEGMPTEGWRVDKAVGYLRGDPGTSVSFKVRRPGAQEAIDYVITREIINVKSVPYYGMFGDDTGYMKVSNFSKRTAEEMREALADLESQGMKSLVLDFRSNPGGLLQAATEVSELFLNKDKLLVYTKGRMPNSSRKYYSANRDVHGGYPVVIMINGASASASEIFAGAMQDWDAAFLVGQTSFGKGTVQTVFNLSETEAIKLTTAKYYTPSGRSIHRDHEEMAATDTEGAEPSAISEGGEELAPGADEPEMTPEEDKEADGETADTNADDADRPIYYTSSGRMVYGGGGITPDLEFEPQFYTDLQRRLERDAFGFSFVIEYLQSHEITRDFKVSDEILNDFYTFLDSRDFEYTEEDLTEENVDYIRTMIAREAVNNKFGRKAMYRVLLNADAEFQHVQEILRESPTLKEMFAYAEAQKAIKKASND